MEEFKAFALRGNVMDMAIGVIIGGAFSGIVTSLTDNFINPILNVITGGATYSLQDVSGFASSFISSVVNFLIMAFILFCLLKAVNRVTSIGAKKEEPAAPTTKKCPFCMTEIDIHATRCPHCTSQLPEETEMCMPGDNITMTITLITPIAIEEGLRFAIREGGRTVGSGVVTEIIE